MNKKLKLWMVSAVLFFSACNWETQYLSKLTGSQARKEKEVAALRLEYDNKLKEKAAEISDTKDKVINAKDKQIKAAVNGLYAADMVFNTIISPSRTDLITNNYVNESWVALGHGIPDYETLLAINDRVKKELDVTKTSLDDLKKNHAAVIGENQKLVAETEALKTQVTTLQNEKIKLDEDYQAKLKVKDAELSAIKDKIIAKETEIANNAAEIKDIKTKFSGILGVISLACLAAAIWSPVFKDKFGIFAAICAGAAIAIWYIQPWMVAVVVGLLVAALLFWAAYKFHITDRTNNAFVNFVNEKGADMSAELKEWLTKYKKAPDGTMTTVPDKAALNLIQQKLVATDRLDPNSTILK